MTCMNIRPKTCICVSGVWIELRLDNAIENDLTNGKQIKVNTLLEDRHDKISNGGD